MMNPLFDTFVFPWQHPWHLNADRQTDSLRTKDTCNRTQWDRSAYFFPFLDCPCVWFHQQRNWPNYITCYFGHTTIYPGQMIVAYSRYPTDHMHLFRFPPLKEIYAQESTNGWSHRVRVGVVSNIVWTMYDCQTSIADTATNAMVFYFKSSNHRGGTE